MKKYYNLFILMLLLFIITIVTSCYAIESIRQGDRRSLSSYENGKSIALFYFVAEDEYKGKGEFHYDFQIRSKDKKIDTAIYSIVGTYIEKELLRHFRMAQNLPAGEYEITHAIYLSEQREESYRILANDPPITFTVKPNDVTFVGTFRLDNPNIGSPKLQKMDDTDFNYANESIKEPREEDSVFASEARKTFGIDEFHILMSFAEYYYNNDWTSKIVLNKLKTLGQTENYKKDYEDFLIRFNKRKNQ